jgi:hypothetical protein
MRPATRSFLRVADRYHAIAIVRIVDITWLHSYENRNALRLIVLITGHGQIGVAAFSYLRHSAILRLRSWLGGHLFASV